MKVKTQIQESSPKSHARLDGLLVGKPEACGEGVETGMPRLQ